MCWSYESSIRAFAFSWALGAIWLWFAPQHAWQHTTTHNGDDGSKRRDDALHWIVALSFVVALIQATEAMMWKEIDGMRLRPRVSGPQFAQHKRQMNRYTRWISVDLWLKPLTNCAGLLLVSPVRNEPWLLAYCVGMSGYALMQILDSLDSASADSWTTLLGSGDAEAHLVWCRDPNSAYDEWGCSIFTPNSQRIYLVGLLAPMLFLPDLRVLTILFSGCTFLYAKKHSMFGETPSHWCYVANASALIPYLVWFLDRIPNVPDWVFL